MIYIEFIQRDFNRYMTALQRMEIVAKETITDTMQRDCAVDYYQRVIKNILSQKFASSYIPLSTEYSKWKSKRMYKMPAHWELSGALMRSLQAFRYNGWRGKGWFSGVPSGATGERGRLIAVYGAAGEFREVRAIQPARPVFTPTKEEYKTDSGGWSKRGRESLVKIKQTWR
uniref:Uncharacterized protein n=1 Tax=viral metagenome TaxID=1070528 RepID=A0A6M3KJ38_9ZZZZ